MPIGGPHLAVREREMRWDGGPVGWACWAEEKRREGRERCGLGWEERRKKFSFFLTQTSFEQNSFENKLNLNFGCYKSYPP